MFNESSLQMMPFREGNFWPKNRAVWQKKGGGWKNIQHFFSCFCAFSRFLALQPIASQEQVRMQPLQKKSYQKAYRRFLLLADRRKISFSMNHKMLNQMGRTKRESGAGLVVAAHGPSKVSPLAEGGSNPCKPLIFTIILVISALVLNVKILGLRPRRAMTASFLCSLADGMAWLNPDRCYGLFEL